MGNGWTKETLTSRALVVAESVDDVPADWRLAVLELAVRIVSAAEIAEIGADAPERQASSLEGTPVPPHRPNERVGR